MLLVKKPLKVLIQEVLSHWLVEGGVGNVQVY